jgi:hypothetical protein
MHGTVTLATIQVIDSALAPEPRRVAIHIRHRRNIRIQTQRNNERGGKGRERYIKLRITRLADVLHRLVATEHRRSPKLLMLDFAPKDRRGEIEV